MKEDARHHVIHVLLNILVLHLPAMQDRALTAVIITPLVLREDSTQGMVVCLSSHTWIDDTSCADLTMKEFMNHFF